MSEEINKTDENMAKKMDKIEDKSILGDKCVTEEKSGIKKKEIKPSEKITLEDTLPQNILLEGEHVEEDKNIYISQTVYKDIHRFTEDKTINESGGILIGRVINELGKMNIVVSGFIEAKYCEATPTTLTFTHETWEYVHKELDRKYENGQIIGWIHTHPNFGIFLSEYDKFIQNNFFKEEFQIAYVIDPIQDIEGFYFWVNGKIEKCKGFYVFDKNDKTINLNRNKKSVLTNNNKKTTDLKSSLMTILAVVLIITNIVLAIIVVNFKNRLELLEERSENNIDKIEESDSILQQEIDSLVIMVNQMQSQCDELSESNRQLVQYNEELQGELEVLVNNSGNMSPQEEIMPEKPSEGSSGSKDERFDENTLQNGTDSTNNKIENNKKNNEDHDDIETKLTNKDNM